MPSTGSDHTCTLCEAPGARACARCKSSHYCSKTCQEDDWPVHKLLCASFSNFDVSARPSETHCLGILFSEDHRRPSLTWLECPWEYDEDTGIKWQHPDLESLFDSGFRSAPITTDALLQKRLSDSIDLCYRDTFLVDGSRPNKSVESVLATLSGQFHNWRGPIVAVGRKGQAMDPTDCRDLDMSDFRYIADYLISYGQWSLDIDSSKINLGQKTIKGVRINCIGDREAFGKPHYEPIDVPLTDAIFQDYWNDTSEIADRIGIPILTRRCPVSLRWAWTKGEGESPCNNEDATFLHMGCDPKTDDWSWAGYQWQNLVGSAIVVRRDKKPLAPMHAEALCTYCRYEVLPLMIHTKGQYAPDDLLTRDFVLQMICRPLFSIHWYKLRERKHKEGSDVSAPFPYDV